MDQKVQDQALAERLKAFQKPDASKPKTARWKMAAVGAGLLVAGGVISLGVKNGLAQLGESDVETFQSGKPPERLKIEDGTAPQPEPLQIAVEAPPAAQSIVDDTALEAMRQQIRDLQAKLDAVPAPDNSDLESRMNDMAARLSAAEQRAQAAEAALSGERDRQIAEAAASAADALEAAKINAPAIVYGKAGGQGGTDAAGLGSDVPMGSGGVGQDGIRLSENEAYLRRGAQTLVVAESAEMMEPNQTLAQGTLIQASLATAINSDLPGNVLASVSEPVPAFSGDSILIPKGSKLFGQYKSDVKVGQSRILILWTRILTPDGKSIEIASVGGDALGVSGLTGEIDKHFRERFGSAALISIIGSAPTIASGSVGDAVASDTLASVGEDLNDAVGQGISDQINIGPTIYVDQGSAVTVMVDRDVVVR